LFYFAVSFYKATGAISLYSLFYPLSHHDALLRLLEDGTSVVLGREPPSEIVVDDPSVSRQHTRFARQKNEVWVEDLDSRNGTFYRGHCIPRERLEPGDEGAIGRVRVVLAATSPPGSLAERSVVRDGDFVTCRA
jgi:pSer/pThr/pTyr-binding forkhead associated (FHA) protein